MAAGTYANMKVYENQFNSGVYETVAQAVDVFNSNSNGAIVLDTVGLDGKFDQKGFFLLPDAFADRTLSGVGAVSDIPLAQEEEVSPKRGWRIGPVANTFDSFKKIAKDPEELAFIVGNQAGDLIVQGMINSSVAGLVGAYKLAAITTNLSYDGSGASTTTLIHAHLVNGLAKMGDQGQQIVAWVMHSKSYYDLVGQAIADKVDGITTGVVINGATPGTMGRPAIVTDAPLFFDEGASSSLSDNRYYVFGLTRDAVRVTESEDRSFIMDPVTGLNNLLIRYQGEGSYNVRLKGLKWNTSTVNPTDAQLATSTNWIKAATSYKSLPGVRVVTT